MIRVPYTPGAELATTVSGPGRGHEVTPEHQGPGRSRGVPEEEPDYQGPEGGRALSSGRLPPAVRAVDKI